VPSVFDISPLSDTVALDDQGNGETTFTVSNHADRARRGRAQVKVDPAGQTQASWFTVEDPEREFPIEGGKQVQQFTVKLKVPTDQPVKGSFKLLVASVRLPEYPDEHFTVGPPVGFEVKAVEPAGKAPFPWWIVVVGVLALVLIGAVVTYVFIPGVPRVPDVVGESRADAEATLVDADLRVGKVTEQASSEKPGTVIATVPEAGAEIEAGGAVNLVVAVNLVEVPAVIGKPAREAADMLKSRGLGFAIKRKGNGPPGIVLDQNPRAGVQVAPNDSVDLFVPEALIPNLIGQPLAKAIDVLRSRGMRLGNITVIDSTGAVVPGAARGSLVSGLVVKQNPPPDRPASAQQVVDLVVRIP
jgi:beta-lactam-binding protein with PASTA domain